MLFNQRDGAFYQFMLARWFKDKFAGEKFIIMKKDVLPETAIEYVLLHGLLLDTIESGNTYLTGRSD